MTRYKPANALNSADTFLMMRSAKVLDPRWKCLVTWADTERGHTGGIYRAAGWEYLGESKPTDVWVDAEGRRVSRRNGITESQSQEHMRAAGCSLLGHFGKHRFRYVRTKLPPESQPSLFEVAS